MLFDMMVQGARANCTGAEVAARAAAVAYIDSFNTADVASRLALFAPDAVFEDPIGSPPIRGHAALLEFWEKSSALDVSMELEHVAANVNTAAFLFTARLSMPGSPAVQIRVIEMLEVDENGLITRLRANFDESSMSELPAG